MMAGIDASVHNESTLSSDKLSFSISYTQSDQAHIDIKVFENVISTLFTSTAQTLQPHIKAPGFDFGGAPLEYIKKNYETSITEHLKEFLFKYCVINFLYRMLQEHKIVIAGEPRLINILLKPNQDALFQFSCSILDPILIHEWRYYPFKAPKRKNYKDLDRQVENFVTQEEKNLADYNECGIQENDWVALDIALTTPQGTPLVDNFSQVFWLQVSNEAVDNPLRDLLIGKKVGEKLITQNRSLQEYFSEQISIDYTFVVTILECLPFAYFCLEQCKNQFRIKTKKELYKKLIEIFSYRNDISQRRSTVEECLRLLLSKHKFEVPHYLILRFQQNIVHSIKENPDYNVYRTQKEFESLMHNLAEKQARELIFLDTLAYHEKVELSRNDIKNYLNFTKRNRTKEFIYCIIPIILHEGQTTLIAEEEIKIYCLREKTINYAIHHLTKE